MGNNRNIQNIWSMTTFIRNDQKKWSNIRYADSVARRVVDSWLRGGHEGCGVS